MDLTIQEADILIALSKKKYHSQREIATDTGHALGMVNKAVRSLTAGGYVQIAADSFGDNETILTDRAKELLESRRPKNAIILAAGFGMRMVPINFETPKALLSVHGERLIERTIRQLNSVGIKGHDIHVVVGFMKEKFEYLMDMYDVDLIVNRDYAKWNNIRSFALASRYIKNTYIIPSDVWCSRNPYSSEELYSWYMVSDEIDEDSDVRVNRKNELVRAGHHAGNAMVGISYLCGPVSGIVKDRVKQCGSDPHYDGAFWEEALYGKESAGEPEDRMILPARVVPSSDVAEINTYEQLRDLDEESDELHSDAMDTIISVFGVEGADITDITVLKKGMTNRSFLFRVDGAGNRSGKYIMRVPGEGTDKLINRAEEAAVYQAISGLGICDDPVYMNPENGYKITKFLDGVRVCDAENEDDLIRCMEKLRAFHEMNLKVDHTFDIFERMEFYHSLWKEDQSMYSDHKATTEHVYELKKYIDLQPKDWCLTHIDAVPDNFLFYKDESGKEYLQLTDWEYAGMQDPHVDIAMFCVYALYGKEQVDHLIDLYFAHSCEPCRDIAGRQRTRFADMRKNPLSAIPNAPLAAAGMSGASLPFRSDSDGSGNCPEDVRTKIYCYIAASGLLWSNWCEYKAQLGVEFGEYSLRQYRFAKDYYRYAMERMNG